MKNKLTLLLIVLSINIFSQQYQHSNFISENNQLKWVKIFKDTLHKSEIIKRIIIGSNFSEFKFEEDIVFFKLPYSTSNFRPYGFNYFWFPDYIEEDSYCSGIIEFKENRYRVTIQQINIKVIDSRTNTLKTVNISENIIAKNKIANNRSTNKALYLFENYFDDIFTINTSKKDEW